MYDDKGEMIISENCLVPSNKQVHMALFLNFNDGLQQVRFSQPFFERKNLFKKIIENINK